MLFSTFFSMGTTLTICFVNLRHRRKIVEFLNSAKSLRLLLRKEIDIHLLKSLARISVIVNLIFLMYIIMQFSYMEKSFLTLVPILFIVYPSHIFLNFLGFVKSFECLFVALLRNFKMDIDDALSKPNIADRVQLMRHYKEISRLNQEFLNLFGPQLAAVTCCSAVMTTVDVGTSLCS